MLQVSFSVSPAQPPREPRSGTAYSLRQKGESALPSGATAHQQKSLIDTVAPMVATTAASSHHRTILTRNTHMIYLASLRLPPVFDADTPPNLPIEAASLAALPILPTIVDIPTPPASDEARPGRLREMTQKASPMMSR